jgi:hypothetical protein
MVNQVSMHGADREKKGKYQASPEFALSRFIAALAFIRPQPEGEVA